MKRALIIVSLLYLRGIILFAGDTDSLWESAVQCCASNREWVPNKVIEEELTYDDEDNLLQTLNRQYYIRADGSGYKAEIQYAFLDGKEITLDEKENDNDQLLNQSFAENPFAIENQSIIKKENARRMEKRENVTCAVYRFEVEEDGILWNGLAWIQVGTGIPVSVEYESKNPFIIEEVTMNNFKGRIDFLVDAEKWRPVKSEYIFDVSFRLSLFRRFNGKIINRFDFSEYYMAE